MEFNFIVITLITGGLVLLSFLNLSNAVQVNQRANRYFGIFVLLWATFWLDEMIIPKSTENTSYIITITRFIQFLTPPTFYLSVVFYTNPTYRYIKKDLAYLFVPLLFLVLLLSRPVLDENRFHFVYIILFLGHALGYTIAAYLKIQNHQKNIEQFSSTKESIDLNWIKYIIYAFIASSVLIIFYNIFTTAASLNSYVNLFFLGVIYFVAFHAVRQREIYPSGLESLENTVNTMQNTDDVNPRNKLITDADMQRIKEQLLTLMQAEQPYMESELNLLRLAEKLNVSGHQLSYVINNGIGENFFLFINKYRVKKAEELLLNPKYDHLTILAIGYASGFNSKTAFNTTFKKMTSYTPTEYRKIRSNG